MLKLIIIAAAVWWLFLRKAQASTVIQGEGPDFDATTAEQLNAAATGDVTVGDEWTATFTVGNGNWSDEYKSHAMGSPE